MTYWIYKDENGHYRWNLKSGNNRIIANSGEGYWNEADCMHAINLVKSSQDAEIYRLNYSV